MQINVPPDVVLKASKALSTRDRLRVSRKHDSLVREAKLRWFASVVWSDGEQSLRREEQVPTPIICRRSGHGSA